MFGSSVDASFRELAGLNEELRFVALRARAIQPASTASTRLVRRTIATLEASRGLADELLATTGGSSIGNSSSIIELDEPGDAERALGRVRKQLAKLQGELAVCSAEAGSGTAPTAAAWTMDSPPWPMKPV